VNEPRAPGTVNQHAHGVAEGAAAELAGALVTEPDSSETFGRPARRRCGAAGLLWVAVFAGGAPGVLGVRRSIAEAFVGVEVFAGPPSICFEEEKVA
jgi:hypothetical protein